MSEEVLDDLFFLCVFLCDTDVTLLLAEELSALASGDPHSVWGHFVGRISRCPDHVRVQNSNARTDIMGPIVECGSSLKISGTPSWFFECLNTQQTLLYHLVCLWPTLFS